MDKFEHYYASFDVYVTIDWKDFFLARSVEYFVSPTYDYSSYFLNNHVRLLTRSIR